MTVVLAYRRPLWILTLLHLMAAVSTLVWEKLYVLFPRSRLCYELASAVNLSGEGNLSTYLQSLTLGLCALLSLCLSATLTAGPRTILLITAVLLGLMSMDEFVMVHERFMLPLRLAFHLSGALYYSWVVLGIPVALTMGLWFLWAARPMPREFQVSVLLAGAVFFSGSLGMEMLTGSLQHRYPEHSFGNLVLCVLEESLESAGSLLCLAAFCQQLAHPDPGWRGREA